MSFVPVNINFTDANALSEGTTWRRRIQLKKASDGSPQTFISLTAFRIDFREKAAGLGGSKTNCPQPTVSVIDSANGILELVIDSWPTAATAKLNGVWDLEATVVGVVPPRVERLAYGSWSLRTTPFRGISAGYTSP